MKRKQNVIVFILILLVVLFTSFGYAALNTSLNLSGEAYVRVESDIRVTDIRLVSAVNASEVFQSKYSKDTITMGVNLKDTSSKIVYEYTVKNENNEDYLIVDIAELSNVSSNVTYTNTAREKVIISAHSSKTFQLTFTATAAAQSSLALQFKFSPDEVTPPVITGGSNNWSSTNKTISIKTPGTATSGVKNYEYYISQLSPRDPGNNITGTTTGNVIISEEGPNYVYYRTVSNTGKKSTWSSYQTAKIDKYEPEITMINSGNAYDVKNSSTIATGTYGFGGGTTTCDNLTTGSKSFNKISSINAFGNQKIKCTAKGNNGLSVSKTLTYKIYALMNGSSMACGPGSGGNTGCSASGTSLIVPAGYVQFGPYKKASAGCYKITYEGSGFASDIDFVAYQNNPSVGYTGLSKSVTSTRVTYYINLSSPANGSGLEIVARNHPSGSITIKSIKIEPVNTCPSS